MHSKLWLLTVLLLSCHHFAYGRLPVPRQFQRFFRMKSSDVNANEKTDPERIEIPLFGFEWLRGSKFIGRLRSQDNVLSRIGRSPQAQEFVLQLSNKIVNYAFAYLALKLISNSVYSAMKDAKSYFDSMKESPFQGSFNATKFLKPNTTLNSHEEEIFSTIVVPSSIESGMQDIGGLSVVKEVLVDMFQPQLAQQQNVTGPLQQLLSPVKSLLLYGPPGCGKWVYILFFLTTSYIVCVIVFNVFTVMFQANLCWRVPCASTSTFRC